jgi:predicted anti-sigma-YlaC factor YlaD
MCPDREILSAYFDREIDPPWDRAIAAHLAGCEKCRSFVGGLEETRGRLRADPVESVREPMERVRRGILSGWRPAPRPVPAWRRRVQVPLPLALLAATALMALGIQLAVTLSRSSMGYIRVTRAPAGGTEYQFAVPYDKVEALLKSVGGAAANGEDVEMTLPKNVKLIPVGQPRMGMEAEYPRKKR